MYTRPIEHQFYLHQDGGLYLVLHIAKNADDLSESVVYEHVWPFEVQVWHRPLKEWESRFKPISEGEAGEIEAQDRAEGARRVQAAKALRRSRQAS